MNSRVRADVGLVERGLCKTRSQASQLIDQGVVWVGDQLVKKSSQSVDSEQLKIIKENMYVSRGGDKLEGALKKLGLNQLQNLVAADVGASTGGFTQCLLSQGVSKVYCIDVGHSQLSPDLRVDSRVINLEGVNIRYGIELPEKVDLVVADLSFISLKLVLEKMFELLKENGQLLTLVKPQFEVGKGGVDKKGIVKSDELRLEALLSLREFYLEHKWPINAVCASPILGRDGNKEYFFYSKLNEYKCIETSEFNEL
ncbi:MAG: TlyA family rRNA (cytidine-2'-O)-methyltransferase [Bdellovibrio sp. CG12_big_fil_rev_8_21_14_0_65_39_13]|nr:MAG: TlyA family rRNA (cytidine-2'-O)-methyltransferase [Bdellovibrio sp. CG22_combo_CG10-13_8_21_14_all_39_27]PIQ58064.1 MAG: TlyA family rRNA (cytidine-2'-O)-methyltransferase [Bdellovibrio sp. CG12_big_fil_rev_8_21_14_0_65_39_13]PIR32940.1 MAG: TlyA family rRNA (cytidine-2'-O)-methyltransferase [Bdellovibrio sp. CG11_big_fil_rev_8_21_14_0_20_39_38]